MENSNVDRDTASKVMNYGPDYNGGFMPSILSSHDYMVLEYVRKNWDRNKALAFSVMLNANWRSRKSRWAKVDEAGIVSGPMEYQAGDYALAALGALNLLKDQEKLEAWCKAKSRVCDR